MSDDRLDEERGGWLTLMEAKDAEIARLTAQLEAGYTVHLSVTSTGEDCPTGTWRGEEPAPTVRCIGDPDAVRGLKAIIGQRDEAIGLLREPYPDFGFSMHQWARRRDAFLARVGEQK